MAVGGIPVGVAAGEGSVWIADSEDGELKRVDPEEQKLTGIRSIPAAIPPASQSAKGRLGDLATRNAIARIEP